MERRSFIKLSAFTAMALTMPLAQGCGGSKEIAIAQPLLLSHLTDAKTIHEAGLTYRHTYTAEDNQHELTQLILKGKNASDFSRDEIEAMLAEQVKNDFKTGNVTQLNGWILSVTEARQCALFSILKIT
jgi:hypothetical protein